MKDFFKPEDFSEDGQYDTDTVAARIANEKLNALIESWPLVFGKMLKESNLNDEHGSGWFFKEKSCRHIENYTHKARLAFIEEISTEECKHEPDLNPRNLTEKNYLQVAHLPSKVITNCKHCGVELVANWTAK